MKLVLFVQASIAAFALAASFLSALQEAIAQQQSRRDANANTSPTLHSAIETIESVETILGDITGWQPSIVVPARHAALEYASENLTRKYSFRGVGV